MKVFNNISPFSATNPVVTIGIFDGVHQGHVEILKRIKELALCYHGQSVVITLWPHPRFVLQPDNKELRLLASLNEKTALIEKHGIDNLIILPFTKELANMPYDAFVRDYIVGIIGARHIVVGYNHHFGKDRKGSFENLAVIAGELGIKAERLPQVELNDLNVSSSGIRHMLEEGAIASANLALGYSYFISGKVIKGNQIGRKLGYPTANIQPEETKKLLPRNGVYAVHVELNKKRYSGMLSIGIRPTIDLEKHERVIEVHIFDFNEDLYDQEITVIFHQWLRNEIKFPTLQELKKQMDQDKSDILQYFRDQEL